MKNGFVNKGTPAKKINEIIDFIDKTSIHTVFRKDVIQSRNQSKADKVAAINRHISHVGYNEKL